MRQLFSIALSLLLFFTATAQKTSEWKLLSNTYLYDDGTFQELPVGMINNMRGVNDVAVDADGLVYIATANGLFTYEKKTIKRFNIPKNGFSDAYAVEFDSKGNLWIGTNGKLIKYKPDGTYENFTKQTHPGFEMGQVREIVIDKNDEVWVVGRKDLNTKQGAGVSRYNGTEWVNYQDDMVKPFVEDLTIDANGHVWAKLGRQSAAVIMYNGNNWVEFNSGNSSVKMSGMRAIAAAKSGKVYFGTDYGLVVYDNGEWEDVSLSQVFSYSKFLTALSSTDQPEITALAVDKDDVVWIGTKYEGVIRMNGDSRVMMNMDNSPITSNSIRKIVIDQNDAKWFLTGFWYENMKDAMLETGMSSAEMSASFNGLVMYKEPDYTKFPGQEVHNFYTEDMPKATFFEVEADKDNHMYLTTTQNVIKFADGQWVEVAKASEKHEDAGLLTNAIRSTAMHGELSLSNDGSLWVISREIMNIKANGEIDRWRKDQNDLGSLVYGLDVDSKGTMWFGNNKGLCSFSGESFNCINKKAGLPDTRINDVFVDKDDKVWIGLYTGAAVFDGTNWTRFSKKEGGLLGTTSRSVIQRQNGDICVGTMKGVNITKDKQTFTLLEYPDGLVPYLQVTALAEDEQGNLWIGTNSKGLVVQMASGEWFVYNSENSALPYDHVDDIVATSEGLWAITSKVKPIGSSSFSSSSSSTTPPSTESQIKKKVAEFDPESALTLFRLQ